MEMSRLGFMDWNFRDFLVSGRWEAYVHIKFSIDTSCDKLLAMQFFRDCHQTRLFEL